VRNPFARLLFLLHSFQGYRYAKGAATGMQRVKCMQRVAGMRGLSTFSSAFLPKLQRRARVVTGMQRTTGMPERSKIICMAHISYLRTQGCSRESELHTVSYRSKSPAKQSARHTNSYLRTQGCSRESELHTVSYRSKEPEPGTINSALPCEHK
jgi:hypothetical protein